MSHPSSKRFLVLAGLTLWAVCLALGLAMFHAFHNRPGLRGAAPADWPAACGLERDPSRWTLVMVIHPRCPCSVTSLAELDEILARSGDRLHVHLLAYEPEEGSAWQLPDEYRSRENIEVHADQAGRMAQRFGGLTSGHVFLFDRAGKCVFNGGITRGRGLEGDNSGRRAILQLVNDAPGAVQATEVFGCPLANTLAETSEAP